MKALSAVVYFGVFALMYGRSEEENSRVLRFREDWEVAGISFGSWPQKRPPRLWWLRRLMDRRFHKLFAWRCLAWGWFIGVPLAALYLSTL